MMPRSAAWLTASAAGDYTVISRAELLRDGVFVREVPLIGGSVSVARTAAIRRTFRCNVRADDATLIPALASDDLSPFGNELRVYRGMIRRDDSAEEMCVGVFRITAADVEDAGFGATIAVSASDRSRSVARARLTTSYLIAAGQNYADAILALLQDRLPGVTVGTWQMTTELTPLIVLDPGSDPWAELQTMASAIGCELYFTPGGDATLRAEVDPTSAPVDATYQPGPTSTLLAVTRGLSDDPGCNGIVMTGEGTSGPPVSATVWNTDVNSPTYYLGPYGMVPDYASSPFVNTDASAVAFGTVELQRRIGTAETLSFAIVPDSAHEVGDICHVIDPAAKVDATVILDNFELPLDVDQPMPCTARERRTIAAAA